MQSLKSEIYSAYRHSSRKSRYKIIPISKRYQCSTWANVLKQAETTVGYSTSFLNLRWLLSDEIANLASSVTKILGTNHPILKTAKNLLVKSDVPSWGLIILLVSKASSINTKFLEGKDRTSGILHTQRMIAEIVETLKTGIYFHKSLQLKKELKQLPSDMNQGNKIALLVGDYLITKSYKILAEINNSEVEEIISSALRDLCEEEFFGEKDDEDYSKPSSRYSPDDASLNIDVYSFEPHHHQSYLSKPKAEWAMRNCLGGAFLLGKGCYAAVKLGERPANLQNSSFAFGVNLALACQARKDLRSFENKSSVPLERVAAPVLFHLEQHPNLDWKNIDDDTLRQEISAGVGVRKTEEMLGDLVIKADMSLEQFPRSEAREYLRKMLEII